jgi:hypothetical protein
VIAVLSLLLVTTVALGEPPDSRSRAPIARERIDAMLTSPARHVRAAGELAATLLNEGARRSYTFAHLLDAIERSDVIVYVELAPDLPVSLSGRLMLAACAHGQRYLRIQIAPAGSPDDLIATLGHELQHAVEVADAPEVRDDRALIELYGRIGDWVRDRDHFDTAAARVAGRTVRSELG